MFVFIFRRFKLQIGGANIKVTAEIGAANIERKLKNLKIGDYSFIGCVLMSLHGKIVIGSRVVINDGVKILTASHDIQSSNWKQFKKDIIIEDFVWIATNAIILPGVTIWNAAVVGAGAVVSKSVNPYAIVVGNPAIEINRKRNVNLDYNPCISLAHNSALLS